MTVLHIYDQIFSLYAINKNEKSLQRSYSVFK